MVHSQDEQREMNLPTKSDQARTARPQEWLKHVRCCRAEGLSLKAYAEQAGLEVQRLYHWRRRLKARGLLADDGKAVTFAGVQVRGAGGVSGTQRLHFPNGLMLEGDGSTDRVLVEPLLQLAPVSR